MNRPKAAQSTPERLCRGIGGAAGTGRGVFRDTGEVGGGFGHTGLKRDVIGRDRVDLKSTRNFLSNDPSHAWGSLQRCLRLTSALFAVVGDRALNRCPSCAGH